MSAPALTRTPERLAEVERATVALRAAAGGRRPAALFILGSGLGAWAETLLDARAVPLASIPGVPAPTVQGHAGKMVFGRASGLDVAALAGRVHLYEGHAAGSVTLALEAALGLGARVVVITNAAGAVHPSFAPGELMVIEDQINRTDVAPFRGAWRAEDPRLRSVGRAYSPRLIALALEAGRALGLPLRRGVYHASRGPLYETPAEVRYLARIGADAVGMSTVAETAVAAAFGAEVLGLSCLTNRAAGLSPTPLTHDEVMETAARARASFIALLDAIAGRLAATALSG